MEGGSSGNTNTSCLMMMGYGDHENNNNGNGNATLCAPQMMMMMPPPPPSLTNNNNAETSNNNNILFLPFMDTNNNNPQEDNNSSSSSSIKSKIMAHPHYPRLLAAYLSCQKVKFTPPLTPTNEKNQFFFKKNQIQVKKIIFLTWVLIFLEFFLRLSARKD